MLLCALAAIACNDPVEDTLQGQANLPITFYGLAVDQSGQPLPGASFEILVDAIPKDWTFAKRGEPHVQTRHYVVSGPDGRFQLDVVAHLLFVENARAENHRHLYYLRNEGNTGYQITAWGQQMYKSDPNRPAV